MIQSNKNVTCEAIEQEREKHIPLNLEILDKNLVELGRLMAGYIEKTAPIRVHPPKQDMNCETKDASMSDLARTIDQLNDYVVTCQYNVRFAIENLDL